jgi:hypothetical protein
MSEMPILGQMQQLTRAERKEARARRRMLKKLGQGIKLCGGLNETGPAMHCDSIT